MESRKSTVDSRRSKLPINCEDQFTGKGNPEVQVPERLGVWAGPSVGQGARRMPQRIVDRFLEPDGYGLAAKDSTTRSASRSSKLSTVDCRPSTSWLKIFK